MSKIDYGKARQREIAQLAKQQARDEQRYVSELKTAKMRADRQKTTLWSDKKMIRIPIKCRCGHEGQVIVSAIQMRAGLRMRCSRCGQKHQL